MPKRFNHLYDEVTSFENLWLAERKAAKGKRGLPAVAAFEFDLEDELLRLQDDLVAQVYRPGTYTSFYIRDPKHRLISAAPFRDRVVHHALCNVIEPIFERTFIGDSYANQVGKGTHRALDRAQAFARRYRYVLQCDVEQFFPSVELAILEGILARKIADRQVMWLARRIMDGARSGFSPLPELVEGAALVQAAGQISKRPRVLSAAPARPRGAGTTSSGAKGPFFSRAGVP